jgi:hypothetical protein
LSTPSGEVRPFEAKDVGLHADPGYDPGAALGNRRAAFINAVGVVLAIAVCLALAVTLGVQSMRNRYVMVPVAEQGNGTLAVGPNFLVADSVLYRPDDLTDFAKDFVSLRYEYDYRVGVASLFAAARLMPSQFVDGAFPSKDQVERLDKQQTVVTLRVDSSAVRCLPRGICQVAFFGKKSLKNVQYSDLTGVRTTPFKVVVTVAKVATTPEFRRGLAIQGTKGDLEP